MEKYSVLMSVYAKEKAEYLKLSIQSMVNQTEKPEQFVIVEDGNLPDKLHLVIKEYTDKYIDLFTIVKLKNNSGLAVALDAGLKECRNEIVARMDSDDISLPERCEKQLKRFEAIPSLVLIGTNIAEFYDDPQNIVSIRRVPSDYNSIKKYIKRRDPFNHPSVMFKKSEVIRCGGYGKLKRRQDFDLFSRMINMGCYAENLDESLVLFRSNRDNYRRRKSKESCGSYIRVQKMNYNRGYCSLIDLLYVVIAQIAMYIMPLWLMKIVSDSLLREKTIEVKSNEKVDVKKVWIIYPKQNFMYEEFKKAGYVVFDPYIGCNKIIPRFFRILHFKSKFPYKNVWYRKLPKTLPEIIIIHEGIVTEDYLKWFRPQVHNVRIMVQFLNRIKNDQEIKLLKKYGCESTTSDPYDCKKYGITNEMSAIYLRHFVVNKADPEYDVYYVGRAKKERRNNLDKIVHLLRQMGVLVKTHIVSPYPYGITLGKYNKTIPYRDVLYELSKTKSILYLSQGASFGITIRVIESAVNQIKLITDSVSIMETPIYRKENVFIIGKDDISRIKEFLNSPFIPIDKEILETFYFDTDVKKYMEEHARWN